MVMAESTKCKVFKGRKHENSTDFLVHVKVAHVGTVCFFFF